MLGKVQMKLFKIVFAYNALNDKPMPARELVQVWEVEGHGQAQNVYPLCKKIDGKGWFEYRGIGGGIRITPAGRRAFLQWVQNGEDPAQLQP